MENLLWLYWLLVAVMVVGIVGAVIPAIPGISLIAGAIFVWGLVKGFGSVGIALAVAIVFLLLSIGVDFWQLTWGQGKPEPANGDKLGR